MSHNIFITLSLFTINCSLITMEPLKSSSAIQQFSNSSSEIYWFVQNIDHNLAQQHHLIVDTKNKLLTTYIALTYNEQMESHQYNELIDINDYMNLNKNNKHYIQTLFQETSPLCIHNDKNPKFITLNYISNHSAEVTYENMLKLPLYLRCKISDKYKILVENKSYCDSAQSRRIVHGFQRMLTPKLFYSDDIPYPYCIGDSFKFEVRLFQCQTPRRLT
jgi:alpha-glucosidase (family GH31 glycosyl hydrolase)